MTGKDLILYILQNGLENEIVIKDGIFVWLMNEEEAAVKFGVGVATIKAWYACGMLSGTKIGDHLYFLRNSNDPRKDENMANKSTIVSYVLAALSGVCFVTGVALLSNEGSAVNH